MGSHYRFGEDRVDSAYKGDIDWEFMKEEIRSTATKKYEKFERLLGHLPKLEYHWPRDFFDGGKFDDLKMDEKRDIYNSQKAQVMLKQMRLEKLEKEENSFITWIELEKYQCTKEEFIKKEVDSFFATYAVVKDSKWYEKGEMGWWGMSSETPEESEKWDKSFFETWIEDLPDNVLLSVYDCHT
jgi:hypothetical protein